MTDVLGSAFIDIVARTGNVKGQVTDGLKGAEAATAASGTRMGGHIGDGLEKGTGRGRTAFKGLAGAITANSNGALGPIQEIIEKGEGIGEAFEHGRKRSGAALLGIGTAVTGVGALLKTFASGDEASQGRLRASIETTGKSFGDYKEEIEKAIKTEEHYGTTASKTQDALNKLTLATHDPAKAIELLGTATNVAAARHIDLEAAATSVGKVFNGNTKILKEFGIIMPKTTDAAKDLEKAQTDVDRTTEKMTHAQEAYHDKLTVFQSLAKPTVAQHVALEAAHRKVAETIEYHKVAEERLIEATKRSKEGNITAEQALKKLADVTSGQASASADTFTGKLAAMKAKVEDGAASLGTKFGGALITIGPALAGVGAAIEAVATVQGLLKARSEAAAAATVAQTVAQTELDVAMSANPVGLIVVAIGALVAGLILAYKHSETFRTIVGAAFHFVSLAVGDIIDKLGSAFGLLGHVPGFGWAKTAAASLHGAADAAKRLGDNIKDLPKSTKLDIETVFRSVAAAGSNGKVGPVQMRAEGGPISAGRPYIVGENGPELVVPRFDGTVIPNHAIRGADSPEVARGATVTNYIYNPIAEEPSVSANRQMTRLAVLGLAGR